MLFNSYIFVFLFFPAVLLGYYSLHHFEAKKPAVGFLILMSMWFYGYNSFAYLCILIFSIVFNYILVGFLWRVPDGLQKKLIFAVGILFNIGILFYYKYYDFFIENVNAAAGTNFGLLRLMLPLGISFYTFQQMSYVIDSYRKECERYSLLEYAAYVSFFPQLIAGPIVYHDELIPQLRDAKKYHINYENLCKGIYAFALGLAKKVLVADTFSKVVTIGYEDVGELNAISVLIVMVCYSLQIYFDFSGYCDMAWGIGYLFNIELPINFHSPYKAASITEFWDRWHMTLTRFFTKYVYIPQSIYLVDEPVRNNIAFGIAENEIDDERIWEALEEAQLKDFIKTLPDGLDTAIGDRGVRISGGQRQRLGIARALYHNPEILVFDEATSALDNETEAAVMDAINSFHGRKTMVIIAHRLNTIEKCDIIYKVDGGKITKTSL